ncbi:MAG: hypothetical protein JW838_08780 [Spirochaetes bacterium]|nr:hypothetical protein [Spirochaetota bacterium]
MSVTCDICGRVLDSDQNFYGVTDENGRILSLCSLHAETSIRVEETRRIDFLTMMKATLRLDAIRPSMKKEPEKWVDWHPLEELVRLYREIRDGFGEAIKPSDNHDGPRERIYEKRIAVPGDLVRAVSEGSLIQDEFLEILAFCCGKKRLAGEPQSAVKYNRSGEPESRTERIGTGKYGLFFKARPISSGVGVHGEEGEWTFRGLPDGIRITARSRLDMRGGAQNYYSLKLRGANAGIEDCIARAEEIMGRSIEKLKGGS